MNRDVSIYVKDILENIHFYFGVNLERVLVSSKRGYTTDKATYKESSGRFKDESEGLKSMNGEEIDRCKEEMEVIYK